MAAVARKRGPMAASAEAHPPVPGPPARPPATPPFSSQALRIEASGDEVAPGGTADQALAAYAARARELFTRIEDCLNREAACAALAAPVSELADDLASVGAPELLGQALQELAEALRRSPSPRAELAAARATFADALVPPAPGGPGAASGGAGRAADYREV